MSALACIGEPISWPRLERFAGGSGDTAIATHVAECPACRHCLDEIQRDIVALPPLAVPAPKRRWWPRLVPAFALAAAAAVAALVMWPKPEEPRADVVSVKGIGEVVLGVVRERGGVIRQDVTTFAPGDRWKVVITCPPSARAAVEVSVGSDHPLVPVTISCGNRVVLPGAFTLTGTYPNRICVRVVSAEDSGTACLTIMPE